MHNILVHVSTPIVSEEDNLDTGRLGTGRLGPATTGSLDYPASN